MGRGSKPFLYKFLSGSGRALAREGGSRRRRVYRVGVPVQADHPHLQHRRVRGRLVLEKQETVSARHKVRFIEIVVIH
jgi:hypothetical protein